MATNRKRRKSRSQREKTRLSSSRFLPAPSEPADERRAAGPRDDVAVANLVCASGLPGATNLPGDHYLQWLDEAADKVRTATDRNYHKFLDSPDAFENSQARFCTVCLVTVLQQQCGVRYNPKWQGLTPDGPVPKAFGIDSSDLFIHAIIDGVGGTCGSLPVLYVAVGRRLGYPLRLVKAARHLFVRWDDPAGEKWHEPERFNIEATGPGVHFLPDEHYRTWPHPISNEDVEAGIFLHSLSTREERAEFFATRGYCLRANGRLDEAVQALAEASQLAPHNRHFMVSCQSLRMHMAMRRRGHAYLNAPVRTLHQEPVGPFWMEGIGGHKVLVQIVSPVTQPFGHSQPSDIGMWLERHSLSTPNGLYVEAWLPTHTAGAPMTAHWVSLSDGRLALVHQPVAASWPPMPHASRRIQNTSLGQPIVPERNHHLGLPLMPPIHEQSYLASQIQETVKRMQDQSTAAGLPAMQPLAISAGPAIPRLPQSTVGISLITS